MTSGRETTDERRTALPQRWMSRPSRLDLGLARDTLIGPWEKGFPGHAKPLALGSIGQLGWNLLDDDLPLPVLTLRQSALENNLAVMASYCQAHSLWLAPHTKTSMSPQILDHQLAAGAWGATVASAQQAQVLRAFGSDRIVIANQVAGRPACSWLCTELAADPNLDVISWVDSPATISGLLEASAAARLDRPLLVALELGWPGGRTGARTDEDVAAIVDAVRDSEGRIRLVGIAVYEGLLADTGMAAHELGTGSGSTIDGVLDRVVAVARRLHEAGDLPDGYLLTGGGSWTFDSVCRYVSAAGPQAQGLLRSGGYATHDHLISERLSPLGASDHRAGEEFGTLQPALELWSHVHSTPEPNVAFVAMGRRDAPSDAGLPLPLGVVPTGSKRIEPIEGCAVTAMNDQHAYIRHDGRLRVGDRIIFGISHPCTAFDKWRWLTVVDDAYNVVDAFRTYF